MSARELLEQAKSLPEEELREFLKGVRVLEKEAQSPKPEPPRQALHWPDAEARRRRIFGDRVLPNLVLEARDEGILNRRVLYADTSLFVSYYVSDANSARATSAVNSASEPFAFTALHRLEIRNALALAVFRKRITAAESAAAWADVARDVRAGLIVSVKVDWHSAFRDAGRLAAKHSARTGTRSFDILHVAAADALGIDAIYNFDTRQATLARAFGLQVFP